MRTTPVGVAALIVIGIAGAPGGTQAKGKYDCKPAITGWGSDGFVHKAKGKAIASYKAKAAAAYGTIVWNNTIGDHCTKLQKGLGWQCWFKAQPCISGGLKPSISKTPLAKPPRYRAGTKLRLRARGVPHRQFHVSAVRPSDASRRTRFMHGARQR